jgi:hypothetical protein
MKSYDYDGAVCLALQGNLHLEMQDLSANECDIAVGFLQ